MHEVMIALGIVRRHADVFIQVECRDLGKIEADHFMDGNQLFIHRQGRAARGQAEDAVRLEVYLAGHDFGGFCTHFIIRISNDNTHRTCLLLEYA